MKILLAIDGSEYTRKMLDYVCSHRELFDATHSFVLFNARIGIRGPNERWAIEFWGQNLLSKDYAQVAFNSPFQEGSTSVPPFAPGVNVQPFTDPQYPGGRQLFSQFLAEPRTYGVTLRGKF